VEWILALLGYIFQGPWIGHLRWQLAMRFERHRFVYLLQGLPALLVAAGTAVLAVAIMRTSRHDLNAAYLREGDRAYQDKDFQTARTCYERVASVEEDQGGALFGLALAVDHLGQPDRALALLNQAAPLDRAGHGRAHMTIARLLLIQGPQTEQALEQAERHLEWALKSPMVGYEARALLGQVYLAKGRSAKDDAQKDLLAKAEENFEAARPLQPDVIWPLAQVYAAQKRTEQAIATGKEARALFQASLNANPSNQRARVALMQVCMFLEDWAGAVRVLEDGLAREKNPEYNRLLGSVYLAWARAPKIDQVEQLDKLDKAFSYDPANPELILHLWKSTSLKGKDAEAARAVLLKAVTTGKATALSYFALGMDAWEQGQNDKAVLFLEKALELGPGMQPVVNNLALVLASSEKPQLERALDLINSVLKNPDWANHAICLDTRGLILGKMGRWKEALTDMQKVLASKPNDREVHLRLAEIYDHLNVPELAAEHRKRAEEKPAK
jgi:tetratricopeptide (TPR) repeat protein